MAQDVVANQNVDAVAIAARYRASATPAQFADGQLIELQCDINGHLLVNAGGTGGGSSTVGGGSSSANTVAAGSTSQQAMAVQRTDGMPIISDATGSSITTILGNGSSITRLAYTGASGAAVPVGATGFPVYLPSSATVTGGSGSELMHDATGSSIATAITGGIKLASGASITLTGLVAPNSSSVLLLPTTGQDGTPLARSSDVTGLLKSNLYVGGTLASSANPVPVSPVAGNGWATASGHGSSTLSTALVSVKSAAGSLFGFDFYNSGNATAWVQVFDALAASVTLGSTTPKLAFSIPPGGTNALSFGDAGIAFGSGILIAAASTATGAGAPASGVDYNVEYK